MAKIVIWVKGGIIQDVFADQECEYLVLDEDTEGAEIDRLGIVDGKEYAVGLFKATVIDNIDKQFEEAMLPYSEDKIKE